MFFSVTIRHEGKYRAALIVDNPIRDLDGLVLLGRKLAQKDVKSCLVPMYTQGFVVPSFSPDVVVLNYARAANAHLIRKYSESGMAVTILETEGGVWESEAQYVKTILDKECSPFVDRYFVWGRNQLHALKEMSTFREAQLTMTGNPRFDFYCSPWKDALTTPVKVPTPYILVLSSSPLAAPRFGQDPLREVRELEMVGYERTYALQRLEDDRHARKNLMESVKRLSREFADLPIVVRPHPFESDADFRSEFQASSNVRIIREGNLAGWIKEAGAIVHVTSSSAVDAYLMGKAAISMDWILNPSLRKKSPVTAGMSAPAKTFEELVSLVRTSLETGAKNLRSRIGTPATQELDKWFSCVDGNSAERVADALYDVLEKKDLKRKRGQFYFMALTGSRSGRSPKHWADGVVRAILGPRIHNALRLAFLSRGNKELKMARRDKTPSLDAVSALNKRLNQIEGDSRSCTARTVTRREALWYRIAKGTILMSAK